MQTLPRKCLLFLSLVITLGIVSHLITSVVFAQNPQVNPQDVMHPETEDFNKEQNEIYDQAAQTGEIIVAGGEVNDYTLRSTIHNISNMIACTNTPERCANRPTALGFIAQAIDLMYVYPPASSILYAYDVMTNAGLVKTAHAQGIGFAGLSPLLPLWKVTRNISYSLIVIIMVAIGFMIIFRMKIDPKTVISVQAALPKIVLTLIIITFSYPIVGFFVDMMYVVMAILIKILGEGIGYSPDKVAQLQQWYMAGGLGQLTWTVFSGGFSSVDDFLARWNLPIGAGLSGGGAGLFWGFVSKSLLGAIGGAAIIPALILLILLLGTLFTLIRILMLLLNSYIQLIVSLVIGPLILLTEAIPGRSAFSGWILNIIANLVVFPTTAAILIFVEFLTQYNKPTPIWQPPLIGVPFKESFMAFLGVGVLFLAPSLIAQVKKIFHPKPVLPISAGTAFAPLTGGAQTAMGAASQFYYMQGVLNMFKGKGHAPGPGN